MLTSSAARQMPNRIAIVMKTFSSERACNMGVTIMMMTNWKILTIMLISPQDVASPTSWKVVSTPNS